MPYSYPASPSASGYRTARLSRRPRWLGGYAALRTRWSGRNDVAGAVDGYQSRSCDRASPVAHCHRHHRCADHGPACSRRGEITTTALRAGSRSRSRWMVLASIHVVSVNFFVGQPVSAQSKCGKTLAATMYRIEFIRGHAMHHLAVPAPQPVAIRKQSERAIV